MVGSIFKIVRVQGRRFGLALLLLNLLVISVCGAEVASDRWIVVHAGTLLAVPGMPPVKEYSIVIRGDRIERLHPGYIEPRSVHSEAEFLDLSSAFVLPGLIDVQNHFTSEVGQPPRSVRAVVNNDATAALNGAWFAGHTLMAGFTTVRDMGDSGRAMFALRDAIDAGKVPGPRMQAAGQVIGPDLGGSIYREEVEDILPRNAQCVGADGCRRALREQVRRGADTIKVYVNHDLLPETESYFLPTELTAMVDAAHQLGRKVTASAFGTAAINTALRAGVDGIVHGVFLDDESVRLLLLNDAFFIPTLNAAETVREMALDPAIPVSDSWRRENLEIHRAMTASLIRAHKAGVRIAFGTDAGWRRHGDNAEQFLHMVAGGMSAAEAIVSATVNAAAAMGWSDRIGTLEPGKFADVIAVEASPLQDVVRLQKVVCVVKGGEIYNCPAAGLSSNASRSGLR